MSDDVIACDLWFGPPPPIKNPGYAYDQRSGVSELCCYMLTENSLSTETKFYINFLRTFWTKTT